MNCLNYKSCSSNSIGIHLAKAHDAFSLTFHMYSNIHSITMLHQRVLSALIKWLIGFFILLPFGEILVLRLIVLFPKNQCTSFCPLFFSHLLIKKLWMKHYLQYVEECRFQRWIQLYAL